MTKSNLFKAAHKLAKTFEGNYSVRLSMALKLVWLEVKNPTKKENVMEITHAVLGKLEISFENGLRVEIQGKAVNCGTIYSNGNFGLKLHTDIEVGEKKVSGLKISKEQHDEITAFENRFNETFIMLEKADKIRRERDLELKEIAKKEGKALVSKSVDEEGNLVREYMLESGKIVIEKQRS